MSPHDSGVTELLRRASDELTPDVDRLVRGGITRGRTRQRRARIGTTVASLAVIGVVGGLAAVVPHLGGADSARDLGFATDGATATDTSTARPSGPLQLQDITAGQMVPIALAVLSAEDPGELAEPVVLSDEPGDRLVEFRFDGMVNDLGIQRGGTPSMSQCRDDADRVDGTCAVLPDGGVLLRWGPSLADGVTCHGANVQREGYNVWATSCNAAEAKDSPPLAPEPRFSMQQLVEMAASDVWFQPVS